jgi:hypothetical protein
MMLDGVMLSGLKVCGLFVDDESVKVPSRDGRVN